MSFNIETDGAMSIAMLFLAHLGLCAAYIQGGLDKLTDSMAPSPRWSTSG